MPRKRNRRKPIRQSLARKALPWRTASAPTWQQVRSMDDFYGWLEGLGDPFGDVLATFAPAKVMFDQAGFLQLNETTVARARDLAPAAVMRFEVAQREALDALIEAVSGVDPAPLLCGVLFLTHFEPWGTHFEPSSPPTDLDVELVSSIVAGYSGEDRRPATADDLIAVMRAAREVRWWAHAVSDAHRWARSHDTTSHVRDELLTRWLAWRGSAYPHHSMVVADALASGHEHNIQARLGFGFRDLRQAAEVVNRTRENMVSPVLDVAWSVAAAAMGESPEELGAGSVGFQRCWLTSAMTLLPLALAVPLDGEPYLLPGRKSVEAAVLRELGITPGTARPVNSVLVDPPHRTRPFALLPAPLDPNGVETGTRLALPVSFAAFTTDFHLLVESLLARAFAKWPSARARAVDEHAVALLQRALPGSRAVTNVYIEGSAGPEEVDGVVVFEDVVLVIEGKGAPLKVAALRGSVEKFAGQLRELVTDGARQLNRDRRHVLTGSPARFFDTSGQCVLEVDSTQVRRCHQVMPCLDGLGDVGTRMPLLWELGVLEESANPWIVALTDVNVVVDLLPTPAEFLGYLDFRDRWTREPRLTVSDELELLLMFLYQVDLSGRLSKLDGDGSLHHVPGQSLLDPWYYGLAGLGPVAERPRIRSTKRFRRFVDALQRARPPGWLAAATAALQVPISVAAALDQREGLLARNARSSGGWITGDREFRYVVAAEGQPYPDVGSDLLSPAGTTVLFLRQQGNRLELEDVQVLTSAAWSTCTGLA